MGKEDHAQDSRELDSHPTVPFNVLRITILAGIDAITFGRSIRHELRASLYRYRSGKELPRRVDRQAVNDENRASESSNLTELPPRPADSKAAARNAFAVISCIAMCISSLATAQTLGSTIRDPQALDILNRMIAANGGLTNLSAIRDLSEVGQITFPSDDDTIAPVLIQLASTDRSRIEADFPDGKRIWITNRSAGSHHDSSGKRPMPLQNAISMGGLTFPLAHVIAAVQNNATQVSLQGIEQKNGRSVYRIRIQAPTPDRVIVKKDLLVDALTFDIVATSDEPLPMHAGERTSATFGVREIDFGNFQQFQGVRVPFSIQISIHGQQMVGITVTQVAINTNVAAQQFVP